MKSLHIWLQSEDNLFSFDTSDFDGFQQTHPNIELVFHASAVDLLEALPEIEYLDTWFFEQDWYQRAPKLKALFTPAAGKDYVKTTHEVTTHFGTFHGPLMAETTLGLILNFTLRLDEFKQQQKDRIWQRLPLRRLSNQTALILGYGSIGRVCGQLLAAQGMKVIGTQRHPQTNYDGEVELIEIQRLEEYLPQADHVISFLPGDSSTKHFVSADRLNLMSPNAYLYNLGRGTTIDESALIDALQKGTIAGAALDVTEIEPLPVESGLWRNQKVVLLPHSSAYFDEYRTEHVKELTDLVTTKYL